MSEKTGINRDDWGLRAQRNGAGTRNRTADLLITNQSLYQLSYPGICKNHGVSSRLPSYELGCPSFPKHAALNFCNQRVGARGPTLRGCRLTNARTGKSTAGVLYPKGGADRKNCLAFAWPDLPTESTGSPLSQLPLGLQAVNRPFESGHRGDRLGVQERQHLSCKNTKHTLGPIQPKVGIE